AEKPKYQTETKTVTVVGGAEPDPIELKMTLAAARSLHRRMPKFVPWAVLATGAIVAGIGGLRYRTARGDFRADRTEVQHQFDLGHQGMADSPEQVALRAHAYSEAHQSYWLLGIGGAVAATGFALVLLNAPQEGPPVVAPAPIGNEGLGLFVDGRW